MKLRLETIVRRKDGRIEHRDIPVNSWVAAASQLFLALLNQEDVSGVIDTGNVSRTLDAAGTTASDRRLDLRSESIRVGSDGSAVDKDQYYLQSVINAGTGAGELTHNTTQFFRTAITGGYRNSITRILDNGSGGTVTIREAALVAQFVDTGATNQNFMIVRDVVSPAIALDDGDSIEMKYHIDWTA